MLCANSSGEFGDHLVIGAAAFGRVDHLGGELQVLMAAGGIDVVVLQKHGGRQDDVGVARGVGHELFVDAGEQIFARKAAAHFLLMRRDRERVRILNEHRPDGRAAFQRLGLASQNCANPGLVETAHAQIADVEPLDHRLLQLVHAAIAVEGAASFVRPGAGDGGNAKGRMHVDCAVALPREAVTEPEEASFRPPNRARRILRFARR